jgi:hypothetical protein
MTKAVQSAAVEVTAQSGDLGRRREITESIDVVMAELVPAIHVIQTEK